MPEPRVFSDDDFVDEPQPSTRVFSEEDFADEPKLAPSPLRSALEEEKKKRGLAKLGGNLMPEQIGEIAPQKKQGGIDRLLAGTDPSTVKAL